MSPTTIACSAMWPLAWPAVALVAATLLSLLLRGLVFSVLGRRSDSTNGSSSLAQAIRLPSILWSAVFGLWVAIVVANETERLSSRLSQPLSLILEVAVILSVTITIANVLHTLIQRVSERQALGGPITGLGQSVARGIVYCVGLLVLLAALGIQITPILTALGVGGLAVALALQDTLSNLFAGVHLLADKPIRVGDYVKVADTFTDQFVVQHELRKRILRRLAAEGVQIPVRAAEL